MPWPRMVIFASCVVPVAGVQAAGVRVQVAPREVVLGEALVVEVSVMNAAEHEPPRWPGAPDFTLVGQSGPSTMRTSINGVVSVTYTYRYQVTAKQVGQLQIPPISVEADGTVHQTNPVPIVVKRSDEGELLFVDVRPDKTEVYVQEPLTLTLRLSIRPYRQQGITLGERDMWTCVRKSECRWGVFAPGIESENPKIWTQTRTDETGNESTYYVFEWSRQVWPERAGPLEVDPVRVVVEYPLRLSRNFFGELAIARSRTLIGEPPMPSITVKPIPETGRPEIYAGAVGSYSIAVTAKPVEVHVGDPITLHIRIAGGTGRLDYVSAPKLDQVSALIEGFKVPEEAPAGVIDETGRYKEFTQSIRAKHAGVSKIPAIPFAYFDPKAEKYITIASAPIPIRVEEASQVDAGDVVAVASDRRTRLLTETAQGLYANYSDPRELLASSQTAPFWIWMLVGGLCPLGYAGTYWLTRQRRRLREDVGFARRRSAGRRARKMLHRAASVSDPVERSSLAATALIGYVTDRLTLPAEGMTRPDVLECLRARQVPDDVVEMTDSFLATCEAARFAGQRDAADGSIAEHARRCLKALETQKLGAA